MNESIERIADGRSELAEPGDCLLRYLQVDGDWVAVRYHPAAGGGDRIAILFCPPFGFDDICTQRPLRSWAARLAAAGHPCLRLSAPGVADSSGGPWDGDRVGAGTRSVAAAARWLRATSGADTVIAIGIGLGGLYAYGAADGCLDGLVLWGTPARGAELIRRLRAFSRMESSEFFPAIAPPPALAEGAMEAGGFVMSPSTVTALKALDLSALPAPRLPLGVLALSLDGLPATQLVEVLREHGLAVVEADGPGFGAMTADPQLAELPTETVRTVDTWLDGLPTPSPAGGRSDDVRIDDQAIPARDVLELAGAVTERAWSLDTDAGTMRGVLTRPGTATAPLGAIFFNAGGVGHVGPNRMWVEAARRWGLRGVASLRLDMPGLGESDGATVAYPNVRAFYTDELVAHARSALDALAREGVAERFVLVGLCSGTFWSLHAGLQDERVAGVMLINPVIVHWGDDTTAARDLRRVFSDRSWRLIRKNATPERVGAVARLAARIPARLLRRLRHGREPSLQERIDATLDGFADPATRLLVAFSMREGLAEDWRRTGWIDRLGALPHATIWRVPVNDHTVRPVGIQQLVHSELDAELDRVLTAIPASNGVR